MNYQSENENGTSSNNVCTFLPCFDSHKYSMKKHLPGRRKHAQDIKQEECDDNGKIYILRLNVFCYFKSLGLLLQLRGETNDTQEMGDVTCRFKTLAKFVPEWPSALHKALRSHRRFVPFCCWFSLSVTVHPTPECGTGTSALLPGSKTFPSMCKSCVGCCGGFGRCSVPSPTTAKGSRIAGTPCALLQQ